MNKWIRHILLALSIGGGFNGLVAAANAIVQFSNSLSSDFVCVVFAALFLFVMASGLLFAENPTCTTPLIVALILQIPVIASPVVSYNFAAGFGVRCGLVGGRFSGAYFLGSNWQLLIFSDSAWGFGLNIVALASLICIFWAQQKGGTPL